MIPSSDNGNGDVMTVPPSTLLEVEALTSGYGRATVVRDVSISVDAAGVTALLGANGAGKTTVLKTIAGLIRPTSGSVTFDGADITGTSPNRRNRDGLCLIPEGRGIFRSLTVRENLIIQSRPGTEKESIERAAEVFPILGDRLHQSAGTLSGGQQQMLAVARAYITNPRLILIDEASLGLAPIVVDEIFSFLETVTREGAALLLVDQFVNRALEMAQKAYVLRRGEVVFEGTSRELLDGDIFASYLGSV